MLLPLIVIFLLAGLVKGVTGMGLPTVAMGLLGATMAPAAAAALLVIPSFVTNVWQLLAGPALARLLRDLRPMMLGIVPGAVLGTTLLVRIDPQWSRLVLGVTLIAYAGYSLSWPRRATTRPMPLPESSVPTPSVPTPWVPWSSALPLSTSTSSISVRVQCLPALIVGILTGVITGATGVFVVPAVPYLQTLRLDKDEMVQALGLSFTVSTLALTAGLMVHNAFRLDQLSGSALAVLPALVGMWLGQKVRARISAKRFWQCLMLSLLLLGLELALRPLG